jgi:hypothetical protein
MKKSILALSILLSTSVMADYKVIMSGKSGNITIPEKPAPQFSGHTFTSCGQTGKFGPSLSQCQSSYSGNEILGSELGFSISNGIQSWTVPETGTYVFEIAAPSLHKDYSNGRGSVITSTVNLNAGEVVNVVVGQRGIGPWPVIEGGGSLGGAGGSFVYTGSIGGSGLIGAAGGGNVNCNPTNLNSCTGGSNNGNHGLFNYTNDYMPSGPGTGWFSSYGKYTKYTKPQGGQRFTGGNESDCGYGSCAINVGGFGGGGGSGNDNIGGSGGYTGGANAANNAYSNEGYPGGSSPVSATRSESVVFTGTNSGKGYVTVSAQ